jgi:hypothetical protein
VEFGSKLSTRVILLISLLCTTLVSFTFISLFLFVIPIKGEVQDGLDTDIPGSGYRLTVSELSLGIYNPRVGI